MEYSDLNRQPESCDPNRVSYLLDSAALAEQDGNSRLAIHLYCAAFEASQDNTDGINEQTLSGLRKAWVLACKHGDRAAAETIFNDLVPYNSDEQTRVALAELQEMAMGQLGLDREEMEDMALALADEIRDAGIDVDALVERFGGIENAMVRKIDLNNIPHSLLEDLADSFQTSLAEVTGTSADGSRELQVPDVQGEEFGLEDIHPELRYADLAGFEQAKERMRAFGIIDPNDTELRNFLRQAESFHGVSGPVLTQNFLFVGSSREDCGIFAQSTANEIGWPVVTMIVDVNEFGDGTIKLAAPVKRPFFGPPRITDLPNPCTLVIQNIDILQELFWNEEQAISNGQGPYGFRHTEEYPKPPGMNPNIGRPPGVPSGVHTCPRSLQHEIIGYLGALFARGGVFVIATSALASPEHPLILSEQLEALLGIPSEIAVDAPTLDERQRVLSSFSKEHPSFHDLDKASLACLSEGMSRYEIAVSCRQAVEEAYSESLKKQRHQMVSLEVVLTQFMRFLAQDSPTYHMVEDYLVALFAANLETQLLQTDVIPQQIVLDLEESSNSTQNETGI
ncbi:MAG: hypothetical protein LBL23_05295 [Coriobacteriales bacterium]|jgi:SpoVK/Ycf46/Vps4 family AAA+-type ATPase|nr:hypothetical protein [Coriobacteriales bacterium]